MSAERNEEAGGSWQQAGARSPEGGGQRRAEGQSGAEGCRKATCARVSDRLASVPL